MEKGGIGGGVGRGEGRWTHAEEKKNEGGDTG